MSKRKISHYNNNSNKKNSEGKKSINPDEIIIEEEPESDTETNNDLDFDESKFNELEHDYQKVQYLIVILLKAMIFYNMNKQINNIQITLMNINNRKKKEDKDDFVRFFAGKLLSTKKKFDTAINNYDEWYNGKRKDGTGYDKPQKPLLFQAYKKYYEFLFSIKKVDGIKNKQPKLKYNDDLVTSEVKKLFIENEFDLDFEL